MKTRTITTQIAVLIMIAISIMPTTVAAQGLGTITPPQGTAQASLTDAIIFLLNAILILAALGVLIALIIGGVQYITSQGDEDAVAAAKGLILGALAYLVVIGLAAAIVNFVVRAIQSA